METLMLRGGRVHSPADPRATAMLVELGPGPGPGQGPGDGPAGGRQGVPATVLWVGGEDAARSMTGVGRVVDLGGAFVAPAFVDAHAHAWGDAHASPRGHPEPRYAEGFARAIDPAREPAAYDILGPCCARDPRGPRPAATPEQVAGSVARGRGVLLAVTVTQPLDTVLDMLGGAAAVVGMEALRGTRPVVTGLWNAPESQAQALAVMGVHAVVTPDPAPERSSEGGLLRLASAGVPLALASHGTPAAFASPGTPGSPGTSPWASVRLAARHGGLSDRAAFTAHTVGGWRLLGDHATGRLVPGAPATYAVWDAPGLVVAAPDDRVQRWSTDPRSAVPGLPDLSDPARTPICLATVVGGDVRYDSGILAS